MALNVKRVARGLKRRDACIRHGKEDMSLPAVEPSMTESLKLAWSLMGALLF